MPTRSRSVMLVLLLLVGGCDTNRSNPPLSPAAPTPPATATTTVRVEGVVVDGDRDEPIGDAFVKVVAMGVRGSTSREVSQPAWSAHTDRNGVFGFTANLQSDWSYLIIEAVRPGYETDRAHVDSGAEASVVLKVQPTLTIHPGESLQTRIISSWSLSCFFPCRRVFVESPPGEAVDIEVTTGDSQASVGLLQAEGSPLFPTLERRITVSSREFWIIADRPFVPVTLSAKRH